MPKFQPLPRPSVAPPAAKPNSAARRAGSVTCPRSSPAKQGKEGEREGKKGGRGREGEGEGKGEKGVGKGEARAPRRVRARFTLKNCSNA